MSCPSQTNVLVTPGPQGLPGNDGADGSNGKNAYTTTSAAFLMPAELATVSVTVANTSWMVVGQVLYVVGAGYMQVAAIPLATQVSLKNLEDTASGLYTENVVGGTTVSSGAGVSPAGIQGPAASLTGSAGGDLAGTYPNPTVNICSLKGDISMHNGAANAALGIGPDRQILHADSGEALGAQWRGIDLSGSSTTLSSALPLNKGGTGQTTQTAAFNSLSPMTAAGDLIYRDAAFNDVRLGIGAAGLAVLSDGSVPYWGPIPDNSNPVFERVLDTSATTPVNIAALSSNKSMGLVFTKSWGGGGVTINLPDASTWGSKWIIIRNTTATVTTIAATDQGANTVISAAGALATSGANTNQIVVLVSDGVNWLRTAIVNA